jgi:protoporphyrin/coproporphyrin ferrochelatase
MEKRAYLLVNFGGPRDLNEIEEFLIELLTDQEVLRTPFPAFLHRILFTRVAKKRAKKVAPDYALIGGKSPIFDDTEAIARKVSQKIGAEVMVFHRYLPRTHAKFIEKIESLYDVEKVRVFPMFPQFSYATTGSIALWFKAHLPSSAVNKLSWVKSYPDEPSYIHAFEKCLRDFIFEKGLKEEETVLLFSAHGLPQKFIDTGDMYESECRLTFEQLKKRFPKALAKLSYQSQFGKEEWIRPFTADVCETIDEWGIGRKNGVIVPLSFTSDHIETLYEIQELYLPLIRKTGMQAYRCPALNQGEEWIESIAELFQGQQETKNPMLIRKKSCIQKHWARAD